MKRLIFFFLFFIILSGISLAEQDYDVVVIWEHDQTVSEFRLYQDQEHINTFPGNVRQSECTITMTEFHSVFSMTAVDGWERESEHSEAYEWEAPILRAPIQLYLQF